MPEHNKLKETFNQLKTNEIKKTWAEKMSSLSMEKDSDKVQSMESRVTRRLALMKKLAGTTWAADSDILRQVYTRAVPPIME
ncbi:hypothetical protein ElyMa_004844300 [Elysia marginata]|uniref:Uncharacterized protein n=1 Tax=Elysia marginata TaxID=1093978 RepID=A0AAV4IPS4_9GAST|nr:hypothetical protein ElyMa_004844300 [Elysia marginata]